MYFKLQNLCKTFPTNIEASEQSKMGQPTSNQQNYWRFPAIADKFSIKSQAFIEAWIF